MADTPLYFKSITGLWLRLSDDSGFGSGNYFSTDGKTFRRLVQKGYSNYHLTCYEPHMGFEIEFVMQKDLSYVQAVDGFGKNKPIFRRANQPLNIELLDYPVNESAKWLGQGFGIYFLISEDVLHDQMSLYIGVGLSKLVQVARDIQLEPDSWSKEINGGLFEIKPLGYYWEGYKLSEHTMAVYTFRFEDGFAYISAD